MPGKPKTNKPFYARRDGYIAKADESGEYGEIMMYGDVVSERPRNWRTGEPEDANYIVESEIISDLKALEKCKRLEIKLNSVGGEVCTAITIHNRLREMSKNGTEITCTVDGVAMSAGSHIMCAADKVRASEGSLIMIHKAMCLLFGFYNADTLRKRAAKNDVYDKAIIVAYKRKTGKTENELLSLMSDETYMTGKEALEHGFVDELIETGEKVEIAATADKMALVVDGDLIPLYGAPCPEGLPVSDRCLPKTSKRSSRIMDEILKNEPEGIVDLKKIFPSLFSDAADTDAGNEQANTDEPHVDKTSGFSDANNQITGGKPMAATNLSELRKENPELASTVEAEVKAGFAEESKAASDEAVKAALAAERERLAKIDKLAGQVSAEMLEKAKYGSEDFEPCSAEELAYKAMLENSKNGVSFMNAHQSGYENSGAADVGACAPPDDTEEADFDKMTDEQKEEFACSEIAKLLGKDGK